MHYLTQGITEHSYLSFPFCGTGSSPSQAWLNQKPWSKIFFVSLFATCLSSFSRRHSVKKRKLVIQLSTTLVPVCPFINCSLWLFLLELLHLSCLWLKQNLSPKAEGTVSSPGSKRCSAIPWSLRSWQLPQDLGCSTMRGDHCSLCTGLCSLTHVHQPPWSVTLLYSTPGLNGHPQPTHSIVFDGVVE